MQVLHLDSSILGGNSVSRLLSSALVGRLRQQHPHAEVGYRDLAAHPVAHLSGEIVGAAFTAPENWSETQRREAALSEALLNEFLAADVVVIGAPMYNFAIPSQLKSWLDRILAAGKTFRYTENGPEGLVHGKKAYIVSSRGGVYSGEGGSLMDFQEDYLRRALAFIGVSDVTVVRAEAVNMGADARTSAIRAAEDVIAGLA